MKSSLLQIAAGLAGGIAIVSAFLVVSHPVPVSAASSAALAVTLQQRAADKYRPDASLPAKPGAASEHQMVPIGPGYDRHWELDVDDPNPRWSCYPGAPNDCFGIRPWLILSIRAVHAANLNPVIRELQSITGSLNTGGEAQPGWIVMNSQLILIKRTHRNQVNPKGKNAQNMTMAEAVGALRIDRRSIAYAYKDNSPVGSSPQICWVADTAGRIFRMPGKRICLFPARLISCIGPTVGHDENLMRATARINALLAKAASENKNPEADLMIAMVGDRLVPVYVQRGAAPGRLAVGPESRPEDIRRVLQIEG